jgi:hypothetical protein
MRLIKLRLPLTLLLAIALSGCATSYTYEGAKYSSEASFHSAVEQTCISAVNNITPLSEPITGKRLLIGVPAMGVLNQASFNWFTTAQGSQPTGRAKEIIENLNKANRRGMEAFYEAASKRAIYSSVQFVATDSMTGAIAPSTNVDVLYYIEPTRGSGQWFYASTKRGKQIFAFDRSRTGVDGKLKGFIEALQVQAVQE